MRSIDKSKNFERANKMIEQTYLVNKGLIKEIKQEENAPLDLKSIEKDINLKLTFMEKQFYSSTEILERIVSLYQNHIQILNMVIKSNK